MEALPRIEPPIESRFLEEEYREVDKEDITIVIPTLNEEEAIGLVIEQVLLEGYSKIIIVDGNSSDNTVKIAKSYGVKVIQQHGRGKTGAIQTAIEQIKTPYMVVIDGDLTYDPADIEKLLPHIKYYNEVIGARNIGRQNIPWFNRLGNYIINTTFNLLFGTKLRDLCSGMYALRTDFSKDLRLNTRGFDVEVEIAAQAASSYSITDVQISYGKRVGERKLHPVRDGLKIFMTVWKLARIYNPILLYSSLAALTVFPAVAILIFSSVQGFLGYWSEGITLYGILLMLFSIQFMTLGIITAQQRRMEQKIINKIRKNY